MEAPIDLEVSRQISEDIRNLTDSQVSALGDGLRAELQRQRELKEAMTDKELIHHTMMQHHVVMHNLKKNLLCINISSYVKSSRASCLE